MARRAAVSRPPSQRDADSVPHPGAFAKAIVTSRQVLASWYILFFQLPRLPEWYLTRGRRKVTLSGFVESRAQHAPEQAQIEAKAVSRDRCADGRAGLISGVPLSSSRDTGKKVTVPTMHVWSDGDIALREKGARLTGDYVRGEYRFEVLKGSSAPGSSTSNPTR